MKVAVIGGGSTYTPELVCGFLERAASFPLTELWLVDVAARRLGTVGGFVQRMVRARGEPFRVMLTGALDEAIDGAAYVITQIRVGGMEARRGDEYLGRRHGLIGQETTGVGGMAKALRTIPVLLKIGGILRRLAPGALLVNFTNPSGLITEALSRYAPDVPAVGVCNVALTTKMEMLAGLGEPHTAGVDPADVELDTLGLNHLSWHRGLRVGGEDLWPQVMEGFVRRLSTDPEPEWDARTIESLGMIPNDYLQYYYYTNRKLAEQSRWPPSRAEEVMALEEELLRQYEEPDRVDLPPGLMKRGGAHYSTVAAQLLSAHYGNLGETHVANVRHGGSVRGWSPDWVLEMP